jgi:hypothetical protein
MKKIFFSVLTAFLLYSGLYGSAPSNASLDSRKNYSGEDKLEKVAKRIGKIISLEGSSLNLGGLERIQTNAVVDTLEDGRLVGYSMLAEGIRDSIGDVSVKVIYARIDTVDEKNRRCGTTIIEDGRGGLLDCEPDNGYNLVMRISDVSLKKVEVESVIPLTDRKEWSRLNNVIVERVLGEGY